MLSGGKKGKSERTLAESLWAAGSIRHGVVETAVLNFLLDQYFFYLSVFLSLGPLLTTGADRLHSLFGAAPKERPYHGRHLNSWAFV